MTTLSVPPEAVASDAISAAGLRGAIEGAALLPRDDVGWIRVTGDDRVRWLNGMVTNSIQSLATGDGCVNFLLNAQGRIQGTAIAFAEDDALLLETDRQQVEPMMAMLDRFIIMDDVALEDVSGERAGLLLAGPEAAGALEQQGLLAAAIANPDGRLCFHDGQWSGASVRVQRMPGVVAACFEVWSDAEALSRLRVALEAAGVVEGTAQTAEWLRLLEGRPKFGADIRERELPQETGQTEALHFSKGCYLGQEIVERIRSRGNVHRIFAGFSLEGELPVGGTALSAGGRAVGELTSLAELPALAGGARGRRLALGYIRREALDAGEEIDYEGGLARPRTLPSRIARQR